MTQEKKSPKVNFEAQRYQRKIDSARASIERYENSKADIDFEISIIEKQIEHYEAQKAVSEKAVSEKAAQNQKEESEAGGEAE